MKILFRLLLCSLAAFSFGCATQRPVTPATTIATPAGKSASLLLISIDGYRPDYLQRGLSPALAMLAQGGVQAASMQPAFPSLTFPNHYTLVTGLTPDHHGVVNNSMFDPQLGKFSLSSKAVSDGRWWAEGTPIWETANRHGVRTATMFWPGSEADIHGHHPDYWKPFDGSVTAGQRVDQVLAWLDLPPAERPGFLTLYFDEVDHAGHVYGPDTAQVNIALRDTDAALAQLVDGLKQRGLFDQINLIVLSDHGMAEVPEANSVMIDELVPLDRVQTVSMGILAGFNPTSDSAEARADFAKVEQTLEQPHPHMQCWDKTRMPARLAYGRNPRVPQLLCLANVHWRITTSDYAAKRKGRLSLGEHGYDNAEPLMQALFVAYGPAFRVDAKLPAFPNVDVYPLMTHLLGIPAAANDGDYEAVKGMLKPAAH
ncbi:phosphodiesterase [Rhodanobacter thiooxydans]|uniref:Phosphodiesterase n=1 Tax=Rhodanobacter thiooxydans TaxID=416169 RepID=A0A154QEJ5_9GAMM|nr:ectonucleotide pyrophosphatase/phosphodiesterase [Rhodanobacter thiooxydans]EIM01317.1 phosphodiesterase I [Rhodanobacter thiooxydans LCS2]KZC22199.1 phosphodiesterase [Rhodanobacter thiooxydans]MCW0201910.1 ectonucleotide pyrophosphatase/phosphodiesterase [Rhodanobacter thiooxydans]